MNKRKITKELIKTTNVLREKYRKLKYFKNDVNALLEETYSPLTQPLKEIEKNTKTQSVVSIKKEFPHIKEEDEHNDDNKDDSEEEFIDAEEQPNNKGGSSDESKKYLSMIIQDSPLLDKSYGVYFDTESSEFKIGSLILTFSGNNFSINGVDFVGTPGLYELLFLKQPNKSNYTISDLNNYMNILQMSNAYRLNFKDGARIKGNSSFKYKTIIKPFLKRHSGSGLMNIPKDDVDYIYWDDPNELVNRLRLLLGSQQAGNNMHTNEIMSIIEELREAKIVV